MPIARHRCLLFLAGNLLLRSLLWVVAILFASDFFATTLDIFTPGIFLGTYFMAQYLAAPGNNFGFAETAKITNRV